jgi:hypothetical protein
VSAHCDAIFSAESKGSEDHRCIRRCFGTTAICDTAKPEFYSSFNRNENNDLKILARRLH